MAVHAFRVRQVTFVNARVLGRERLVQHVILKKQTLFPPNTRTSLNWNFFFLHLTKRSRMHSELSEQWQMRDTKQCTTVSVLDVFL